MSTFILLQAKGSSITLLEHLAVFGHAPLGRSLGLDDELVVGEVDNCSAVLREDPHLPCLNILNKTASSNRFAKGCTVACFACTGQVGDFLKFLEDF